jgi:hypothetical protein
MAAETFSGSFDSTSLPLRGREVPLRMTGVKFLDLNDGNSNWYHCPAVLRKLPEL